MSAIRVLHVAWWRQQASGLTYRTHFYSIWISLDYFQETAALLGDPHTFYVPSLRQLFPSHINWTFFFNYFQQSAHLFSRSIKIFNFIYSMLPFNRLFKGLLVLYLVKVLVSQRGNANVQELTRVEIRRTLF